MVLQDIKYKDIKYSFVACDSESKTFQPHLQNGQ